MNRCMEIPVTKSNPPLGSCRFSPPSKNYILIFYNQNIIMKTYFKLYTLCSFFYRTKINFIILFITIIVFGSNCSKQDDTEPSGLPPTIISFTPTAGSSGINVTITGTNFSSSRNDNVVSFNGTTASVLASTSTLLTVSVPTGATTGKLKVQVDKLSATSADDFTITTSLTISNFSPTMGASGSTVTITGTNFSAVKSDNSVKFNDTVAEVIAATNTSLSVKVPDGTTGKITVEIGSESATSVDDFVYNTTLPTVSTVAGSGTFGFANGTGSAAKFYQPTGVAADGAGNLYVADAENHLIRKINSAGEVTTLAGSTSGFVDGTGSAAKFNSPRGIAVDVSGNVYVADGLNHSIRKITAAGQVTTLAGDGTSGFVDGNGDNAKFYFPKAIAVDATGNLYVADDINHRIRKVTPGGTVTTFAGSTSGYADGIGVAASFKSPRGICIDAAGNVYVADTGNHKIRKISSNGTVTTLAGSTLGFGDGDGSNARFSSPAGVEVDVSGNVYVADDENERIRKITPSGTVTSIAGDFVSGFTNGIGTAAKFNSPTDVAIDAAGNIYVADRHNHAVRKLE